MECVTLPGVWMYVIVCEYENASNSPSFLTMRERQEELNLLNDSPLLGTVTQMHFGNDEI